jgi:hypothetical protein
MRTRAGAVLAAVLALVILLAGCGTASSGTRHSSPRGVPVGVYLPGEGNGWSAVARFGQLAGQPVSYVLAYLGPSDPFPAQLGAEAAQHHAELVLQMQPSMSMQQVAAGGDDAYLTRLAAQVGEYRQGVILSWAAEANGNWYQWGFEHTPVSDYRAAWARVLRVFRSDHNVTWMDTLNRTYAGAGPTSEYVVPGVAMYGIDAYYEYPGDTFASVFGPTLAQIRAVTGKPVLVNETAIGQVGNQAADIPGLVRGVRTSHLAGLIWFDVDQGTDVYHEDWALTPAGAAALRASLAAAR